MRDSEIGEGRLPYGLTRGLGTAEGLLGGRY